jgi:hypothetical protein
LFIDKPKFIATGLPFKAIAMLQRLCDGETQRLHPGELIIDSKDGGVPYSPNQRARREEQKFSLSIRNPIEGA